MRKRSKAKKHLVIVGLAALVVLVLTVSIKVPRLAIQESENQPDYRFAKASILTSYNDDIKGSSTTVDTRGATLLPGRKNIYDRHYNELAVSFVQPALYARLDQITNPADAADRLSKILGRDREEILSAFQSGKDPVELEQDVSDEALGRIKDLDLPGLDIVEETNRFYPHHHTAAHVVGFWEGGLGFDGIEFYYDKLLTEKNTLESAGAGTQTGHLVLTLDLRIQSTLEQKLHQLLSSSRAASGSVIIMNPSTGAILGLVNLPSYDPNLFWDYDVFERKNSAVSDPVYPGAINRLFYKAASEIVHPGNVKNFRPHSRKINKTSEEGQKRKANKPWLQWAEGNYLPRENAWLIDSDDQDKVKNAELTKFVNILGFQDKTAIDLPSATVSGFNGKDRLEQYQPEIASSSTTAMHLLTAFSLLVNGGKPIRPHFLEGMWQERFGFRKVLQEVEGSALEFNYSGTALLTHFQKKSAPEGNGWIYLESLVREERKRGNSGEVRPFSNLVRPGQGKERAGQKNEDTFQSVMLGALPAKEPVLAMVVVLNGARKDLAKPSMVQAMVGNIQDQLLSWAMEDVEVPSGVSKVLSRNRAHKKWLAWQKRTEVPVKSVKMKRNPLVMPDVRGYSLRKALQALQTYDVGIKIAGAGRVNEQYPPPGAAISGANCILELKVDQ